MKIRLVRSRKPQGNVQDVLQLDPIGLSAPDERGSVQKTWNQENKNLPEQLRQVSEKLSPLGHQQPSEMDQDGIINVTRFELDQKIDILAKA